MTYNEDFDADAILRTMEALSRQHAKGTSEDEALRVCSAALLFIRDDPGKLVELREFFRKITTPAIEGVQVAHTFASRGEAEVWLLSGTAKDGQLVRVPLPEALSRTSPGAKPRP